MSENVNTPPPTPDISKKGADDQLFADFARDLRSIDPEDSNREKADLAAEMELASEEETTLDETDVTETSADQFPVVTSDDGTSTAATTVQAQITGGNIGTRISPSNGHNDKAPSSGEKTSQQEKSRQQETVVVVDETKSKVTGLRVSDLSFRLRAAETTGTAGSSMETQQQTDQVNKPTMAEDSSKPEVKFVTVRNKGDKQIQDLTSQYTENAKKLRKAIDSMSEELQSMSVDKDTLKTSKKFLQKNFDKTEKIFRNIKSKVPEPEMEQDFSILKLGTEELLKNYRELYPYADSNAVSSVTSMGSTYASNFSNTSMRFIQKQQSAIIERTGQIQEVDETLTEFEKQKEADRQDERAKQDAIQRQHEEQQKILRQQQQEALRHQQEQQRREQQETQRRLKEQQQERELQERTKREKQLAEKEAEAKLEQISQQMEKQRRMKQRLSELFLQEQKEVVNRIKTDFQTPPGKAPEMPGLSMIEVFSEGKEILDPLKQQVLKESGQHHGEKRQDQNPHAPNIYDEDYQDYYFQQAQDRIDQQLREEFGSMADLILSRPSQQKGQAQQPHQAMTSSPKKKSNLNPHAPSFELNRSSTEQQPVDGQTQESEGQTLLEKHEDVTKLLVDSMNRNRLPVQEPHVFNGDPLSYTSWKSTFSLLIGSKNISEQEKLLYLDRYVSGPAKEAISGMFLSAQETSFKEALKVLETRYGNEFAISTSFKQRYENWPTIKNGDGEGLRKLSDFLNQCVVAIKVIGQMSVFNEVDYQRRITDKLPNWMSLKWGRRHMKIKKEKARYPTFGELAEFVTEEADYANEPGLSKKSTPTGGSSHPQRHAKTSYNTEVKSPNVMEEMNKKMDTLKKELTKQITEALKGPGQNQTSNLNEGQPNTGAKNNWPCIFCRRSGHHVTNCFELMKKPFSERHEFIKTSRLCFGCAQSTRHQLRSCPRRAKCKTCGESHLTILHRDDAKNDHKQTLVKESELSQNDVGKGGSKLVVSTNKTQASAGVFSTSEGESPTPQRTTMIVPVYISSEHRPEKEVLTYALLDTQSHVTFIAEELCETLQAPFYDVTMHLNTMTSENKLVQAKAVNDLRIRAIDSEELVKLSTTYSSEFLSVDPETIPTPESVSKHKHLSHLSEKLHPFQETAIAGLLIGYDNSNALMPLEVIKGEPFAVRTKLGWTVIGEGKTETTDSQTETSVYQVNTNSIQSVLTSDLPETVKVEHTYRTTVREASTTDVLHLLESDFVERETGQKSQEDIKFMKIVQENVTKNQEGHYELPLPFRHENPSMPDNKTSATWRAMSLKRQLEKNEQKHSDYRNFMNDVIAKGHAEKIPANEIDKPNRWYIPHHGVYSDRKPGKIRVVFDCSARYQGACINDQLLQGPDLINSLIGVLCRFRKGKIAFSCDIQQMYHQFHVTREHRDYLRFLWWEDGDLTKPLTDYRMKVHIFGASSSPGCANFGLKQVAKDNADMNNEAADFLQNDFYVDDGLHASDDITTATNILQGAVQICQQGKLRLHKITSNSPELLSHFPAQEISEKKTQDLGKNDSIPIERILGLQWSTETDTFTFSRELKTKPLTRRGMLSTVASLYDPLGFISPIILKGKKLVQQACKDQVGWDDPLSEDIKLQWQEWLKELETLHTISISRSFVPPRFTSVVRAELHHFSDASETGYGQCSYLRLIDENNNVHCSLVMAKSRVAPLKTITIPRLELQAATLSVKVAKFLEDQLQYDSIQHHFWTDSKIVLAYISNKAKKFHVFVANRVSQILQHSEIDQWSHIASDHNPADMASRGKQTAALNQSVWFSGPDFLWNQTIEYSKSQFEIPDNDIEVHTKATSVPLNTPFEDHLVRASSWSNLIRGIGRVLRKWLGKIRRMKMSELESEKLAEQKIIKATQRDFLSKPSPATAKEMKRLDCRETNNGFVVVGGRLSHMKKGDAHPIVIPRESHIATLLIRDCHQKRGHSGRTTTLHAFQERGYWIFKPRKLVDKIIKSCVPCIKRNPVPGHQKMADLPEDRVNEAPPFTYCGMDCFGPFLVKDGRKTYKRYALLVTCLASRSVHLEILDDMSTDEFISAMRRVIALRGQIRQIRSDQGTNFIGASNELKKAWKEINKDQVRATLLKDQQCEWVFNCPAASSTGGVWERMIRSARRILNGLMTTAETRLTTSSLRTLLYEVMAIMNSRPLSVESLEDPTGPLPLTPNHILTMKSCGIPPPPGAFIKADVYMRKQWRKIQYLSDQFWKMWRRDYLATLQSRRKWQREQRNLSVGDIVLLIDDSVCRSEWRLARVEKVYPSADRLVRSCQLRVARSDRDPGQPDGAKSTTLLDRHVTKVVLLVKACDDSCRAV